MHSCFIVSLLSTTSVRFGSTPSLKIPIRIASRNVTESSSRHKLPTAFSASLDNLRPVRSMHSMTSNGVRLFFRTTTCFIYTKLTALFQVKSGFLRFLQLAISKFSKPQVRSRLSILPKKKNKPVKRIDSGSWYTDI